MEESHDIVIVGGGICGLATTLALHRKGIASLVLEKSETLRVDGGSIGVHVNGWRVLEQLGIAAELRETANLVTAFHDVWQEEEKSTLTPVRSTPILQVLIGCDGSNSVVARSRSPASRRAPHAMGSYIGQGGSAALEDALVLARSLARAAAGSGGGRADEPCEKMMIGAATTAIGEYIRERRLRVARLSLEAFVMGELLRAKSLATKLACLAILALLGTKALSHTNYDCGRL
ncbi:unnamed protein product [Miscanthus lutarioriparius]|uniref:FAD-binding domain-containing protein n=1 Tax=Miscanthus lutarioriparius TaxID=422564 RepID=A0A811PXQ1_9POAL|nr:unnamed protein product [Miscanthus lutarioriparius]